MYSLKNYQFNTQRSGEILKRWLVTAGISQSAAARAIGVTDDTLSGCLRGNVKQPTFSYVVKICILTGHTIEEYLRLVIADDPVEFANDIVWSSQTPAASNTSHSASHAHHVNGIVTTDVSKLLDRLDGRNREEQRIMAKQHEDTITALTKEHDKTIKQMESMISRLEKRCTRLIAVLIAENIAFIGVLLYDISNLNVGWFRGLFNNNSSQMLNIKS